VRLSWSDEALADLESIAERAPVQAGRVVSSVERLVQLPLPGMHRRLAGGRGDEHVLTVPPHVVLYTIDGETLNVVAILDARRQHQRW